MPTLMSTSMLISVNVDVNVNADVVELDVDGVVGITDVQTIACGAVILVAQRQDIGDSGRGDVDLGQRVVGEVDAAHFDARAEKWAEDEWAEDEW